jgi:uncharacterized protein (TIGR03437 family)
MRISQYWGRGKWCRCASLVVALCTTAHAAGTKFSAVLGGSGGDYAASVASDAAGNTYIAGLTNSVDFPVTAGAFQTVIGGNGVLAGLGTVSTDAFVARLAPNGSIVWATYLGGTGDDYATAVGVDTSGNVVVTGWTRSTDFPVFNAVQGQSSGGWDAFVTKFDPTGSKLIFSTYLGGAGDNGAYALALDASGNAYIAGSGTSGASFGMSVKKIGPQGALVYSFFIPNVSFAGIAQAGIAVDSTGAAYVTGTASYAYPVSTTVSTTHSFGPSGLTQALVFKLSPDGSHLVYTTALGGSANAYGQAIAVDSTGAAYVAGSTNSVDFPLVNPVQRSLGARPLWKSSSSGIWTPTDNLPFASLQVLVADPVTPATMYAGTSDRGIFKSLDGGATWTASNGIAANAIQVLTIDPANTQIVYAATGSGVTPGVVYQSVNGGIFWSTADSSASGQALQVLVDAQNPNTVYTVWNNRGARKSTDAGATWSTLPFPGTSIAQLALDPRVSGNMYAYSTEVIVKPPLPSTTSYIWHSTDGGNTWTQITSPAPGSPAVLTIDPSTNPSTVYNGLTDRSNNNGATWTVLPPSQVNGGTSSAVAVDTAGTLYAAVYNSGIYTSSDQGQSWNETPSPVPPMTTYGFLPSVIGIVPTGATIYAITQSQQTSGFVTKLSPDGSAIVFSTLLNGHESLESWNIALNEPGVFETQNWISGIALDSANNVTVAGGTRSSDFPTANGVQSANAGYADAFVATLAAGGSKWNYSTYYGGSGDDAALAVTVDPGGNLVFAGMTWSANFPVTPAATVPGSGGHAFVTKLTPPAPPAITAVLNGASFQPGVEAGSWAMITGANLANTTRTWTAADFTGNNPPTELSGVSVTIDGRLAEVYYISPTQINVQAPDDTTLGAVSVVVNNNGAFSAPATVQLQNYAPAFFLNPGTASVIASVLPNYTLVSQTAPASPGDTVVLWGTGFGPASPAAATPLVTVAGIQVPVLNSQLTAGALGLYQITIQLPASVPAGSVTVQASVGGLQTQAGTTIFIGTP